VTIVAGYLLTIIIYLLFFQGAALVSGGSR
jgi:hypothetical protein